MVVVVGGVEGRGLTYFLSYFIIATLERENQWASPREVSKLARQQLAEIEKHASLNTCQSSALKTPESVMSCINFCGDIADGLLQ